MPYKLAWLVFIFLGAVGSLHLVWDTLNGLMAIPNLIAVLASIGLVRRPTREFFAIAR
jgi:AGCS family alanine or glycine:cation symporter